MDASAKTVVVVENEPVVRLLAATMLSAEGFNVIETHNAAEALAALQIQAVGIHVLFTDIHMPGLMDGLALARHAHFHWPWIGLILTSGRARPSPAELPVGSRFLAKPYDFHHMIGHVRALADYTP